MHIFQRLKKSQILLFSSLLSVVWLTLIPLAQAIPAGISSDGSSQRLIICTSQGMVWINPQIPDDSQKNNGRHDLGSCVICFSHSVLAKILVANNADFRVQPVEGPLLLDHSNYLNLSTSACELPEARAPPVHIQA